jgi:hypothetical protein
MSALPRLAPAQEQVLALISAGSTISDAAHSAGVHRNTIHNWLRSEPGFQRALHQARRIKAVLWREQAEDLAAQALETIRSVMTGESTPAAVRLKAAQEILAIAMAPPVDLPPEADPPEFTEVHNSAQSISVPFRRALPKTGRNDSCPCGSGRKFKHCCLNSAPTGPEPASEHP